MAVAGIKAGQLLKPRVERIVAALDVGSSKVAAIIAKTDGENPPQVLGTGVRVSNGLRRGLVSDMAKTEQAIRAAMDQAEKAANIEIESVIVNLSAGDLDSDLEHVDSDIAGRQVTDADIQDLLERGRLKIEEKLRAQGRSVLHAEPALYTIDGQEGLTNPRDFYASTLEVAIHVLTAATPPCRNLDLAVRNAHLGVDSIVASGVVASASVLNAEERDLGVALVEIGAGVTTVAVYGRGMLAGLISIPMGAGDITADIASAFATRRAAAERMKTLQGSAVLAPRDNHDMVEVPPLDVDDGQETRRIPRAELINVIRARLEVLFQDVDAAMNRVGFTREHGRQVVLTGGGAELRGIVDFAQTALDRNVRIGRPRGLIGLPDAQSSAAFSTLAGLVLHVSQPRVEIFQMSAKSGRGGINPGPSTNPVRRLIDSLFRQI